MKRRTFISLMSVMAAAGVLTLAGCSNSSSSTAASGTAASVAPAAGDQLSNIQSSGKLIVALEGAWQPWSFHDESDTLVGYDVEVSRAIAEKLGVEPEYVESDWDSLFAGLDAGRYDIVCNGVEVTDERAKTYDFTEPYGYIHTALAVRKDNDEITSFEDLKGKTTANSLASTYMELAESYGATVQGIDTLEETIQLLTAGRIDATLNADVSFYDYLNVHPDADFKLVAQTEDASHVAIPLRKGDASATLLDAINKLYAKFGCYRNALHSFAHADGGYHLMGCILSAASSNKWWSEEILHTDDYAAEQALIPADKLGANDVYFLPYLMGERSPHNDPAARGAFVGLRMDTPRAALTQAVLEGVAFAIRDCVEIARAQGVKIKASTLCGGGAKSTMWREILANVLGIPLTLPQTEQGPGYGGAMLAAVACGAYPSVQACAEALVHAKSTTQPDAALVEKYNARYAVWHKLYPALKVSFAEMEALQ